MDHQRAFWIILTVEKELGAQIYSQLLRMPGHNYCFGHIHEGWGAKLVTWRDTYGERPTHFTAIDNSSSHVIETLASLEPSRFDTKAAAQKLKRLEHYKLARCCHTSHCTGNEYPINNEQTLFVNASIQGSGGLLTQRPWLVDIELRRAVR